MKKKTTQTIRVSPKKFTVSMPRAKEISLYDKDFYRWTKLQADLLKNKQIDELDIANLIEEIISLGKSDKRALTSHMINLLHHLLKKDYQPKKATKSWNATISNSLIQIELVLNDSPSLKRQVPGLMEEAYKYARKEAANETGLSIDTFPVICPKQYKIFLDFSKKQTP